MNVHKHIGMFLNNVYNVTQKQQCNKCYGIFGTNDP